MRGGMYRGQPFEGDLEKCHKQKEIMALSDLATSLCRRQLNPVAVSLGRKGRLARARTTVRLGEPAFAAKEPRDAGSAPFVEFQTMIRDAIEQRLFRNDLPVELISKSLAALVEATIDLTASNSSKAKHYRDSGFQMFWSGVTK